MDPATIKIILILVVVVVLFQGAVATFKRSFFGALLCAIFLMPVWLIWAAVEAILLFVPDENGDVK